MKRTLLASLLVGCGGDVEAPRAKAPPPWSDAWILAEGQRYLDDPAFRRAALEESLTEPSNVYSVTRLSAYGLQDSGWDRLPVWNPRTREVDEAVVGMLGAGALDLSGAEPLWDGERPTTFEGWAALGRVVFHRYPLRPEPQAALALLDPELSREVGLGAVDGTWPGVVAFEDIDGQAKVGITCALCHVSIEDGVMVEGRARRNLDYGRMWLAWHRRTGAALSDAHAARMASWGPGRADITADDDEDPVAIVDLWALRSLRHLTQAATVTHQHPAALAIRQETQILHANRERTRPPRELAWALAVYLYSLQPPAPATVDPVAAKRGSVVFEGACSKCHDAPTGAGTPLKAERIGTDPNLAHGTARGTGLYRPAPLVRVGQAAPYLHDGSVGSLEALLDRERFDEAYPGVRGVGAVEGHAYGLDLAAGEREDLLVYLRSL